MDGLVSPIKPSRLRIIERLGMYPLDSRFMPPPGPDFLRVANGLAEESFYRVSTRKVKGKTVKDVDYHFSETLHQLYLRALREPGFQMQVEVKRGVYKEAMFVPGHIWSENWDSYIASTDPKVLPKPVTGPAPADVLVLGKMPWKEELTAGRNFVSTAGKELLEAISGAHIKGSRNWYVTNLVKFMPPDESTTLKASWVADCLPLLAQELRIVRPKFILCLGADACRYLLKAASRLGRLTDGMKKFSVGYLEGRTIKFEYYIGDDDDSDTWQPAKVVVTAHPAAVVHDDSAKRQLQRGITRFGFVTSGKEAELNEDDLDHRVCETLEEAELLLQEANVALATSRLKFVAWDAEWQGQHPCNEGSYIRTVQMSWKPRQGVCFKLRHAGGAVSFVDEDGVDAIDRLMAALTEFMKGKRAVGHFLVADLEWLQHAGFDLLPSFVVPTEPDADGNPAWYRCQQGEGGFDTAMACHAIEETSFLGLEILTMRYTVAPRYDIPLEDWKVAYCKQRAIKPAALEGYGDCPDEVLIPYAIYDADVSLRIAYVLEELLSYDYFGQNAWEAFWESMLTQPVILEIHQTGISVDRRRIDKSTKDFLAARNATEKEIKEEAEWPELNLRSTPQIREYLFGEELNRVIPDKESEKFKRLRPPGAKSLGIMPLVNTDKRPKRWVDLVAAGVADEHSPSTSKSTLAILAQDNPEEEKKINRLRDHRFLDQVLKSVLRPPLTDKDGVYLVDDDNGCWQYDKGLAASINDDGRVRPNLRPTAETGRWKCARPNLQNLCLSKEHEVLTRRGWVKFPDLCADDEVAQFWPDTESIDFVVPSQVVRQHYKGALIRLSTQEQIEIVATPNHRCLVRNRKRGMEWKDCLIEDVPEDVRYYHAGVFQGGDKKLSEAWVIFLSAVQADGNYPKQGGGIVFTFSRERKILRLTKALQDVCPEASVKVRKQSTYIYIPVASEACKVAKALMPNKQLGPWLLDYNRETLDLFCKEVFFWDGNSTRNTEFCSSDRANVDWVQVLFTISGRRARLRLNREATETLRDNWIVSTTAEHRSAAWSMTTNLTKEQVSYDDTVYCVTVPSSYFITRLNGKVSVTGNSKARDPDYERLLGKEEDGSPKYKHKIRSILCSPSAVVQSFRETWSKLKTKKIRRKLLETYQPILGLNSEFIQAFMKDDGIFIPGQDEVFVDFDFKGAELYGMAIMSGDLTMIEHAQRNILYADEGYDADGKECAGGKFAHPQYFDIHSNVAVMAFRLTVPDGEITNEKVAKKLGIPPGMTFSEFLKLPVGSPLPATKNALVLIEKSHLRIVAKSVIFGVAYGRAAKAIALAVREQKVEISENEAQQVIDALFAQYTKLKPYFEACCARATQVRWLCNCYGRFRRFPEVEDSKAAGEFERQSMNFPIQSTIASSLNRGVSALYSEREAMYQEFGEKPFLFCLTIHDAVLIQAKAKYVDRLINGGVIERAMCKTHPIYPADLAGMPLKGGPYYLGLDFEVSEYWSEPLSESRSIELGVPTKFA